MSGSDAIVTFLYSFFAIDAAIFGIIIGSFLNVVIYRIPEERTIVKGHSMCMSCGHTLAAKDLVPLLSWLFLKGKCRYCGAPVASRYAKIESFTGLVFLIGALTHLDVAFIFVSTDKLFISQSISFVMFAISSCAAISAMMIYHDTSKGYRGLALLSLISGFIALISKVILRSSSYNLAYHVVVSIIAVAIFTGIIFLIFKAFKNKYSMNDLWADLTLAGLLLNDDYTTLIPNKLPVPTYAIQIIGFAIVYGMLRAMLKKTKKDKIAVIIGFVTIVIFVVLRYSIMKF